MVEDIGPFGKLAGPHHSIEPVVVNEVIIDVVDLARALARVVAETDMVTSLSASSSIREIVDLPAPEGDERTIRRPRRWRGGWSMAALASGEPWPSSDGMVRCTKKPLKWCGAMFIVQCSIFEGRVEMTNETETKLRPPRKPRPRLPRQLPTRSRRSPGERQGRQACARYECAPREAQLPKTPRRLRLGARRASTPYRRLVPPPARPPARPSKGSKP